MRAPGAARGAPARLPVALGVAREDALLRLRGVLALPHRDRSADGWADWIVFGVVVCAALGGALAVWQRQYPAATKKRVFTRDSESNW